jgi:hypothetical protein
MSEFYVRYKKDRRSGNTYYQLVCGVLTHLFVGTKLHLSREFEEVYYRYI